MGVLETLRYFKTPVSIKIYSDSQYVVNSIVNKYVYN
jgi:ribonuclease HI